MHSIALSRPLCACAVVLTLPWLAPAAAQVPNDNCADAIDVIAGGQYDGTLVGATNDGASDCGSTHAAPDAWYRFTAAADGQLFASLCESPDEYDSVLSVHGGCPGDTSNVLFCNDESCNPLSSLALPVVAGNSYLIRVSGWSGAIGSFRLAVDFGPTPPCEGGPDIIVSSINGVARFGADNGITVYGVGATACNPGCAPVQFIADTPNHAVFTQNLYRLMSGRFEHIGRAWVKHTFGSSNSPGCGDCVQPPSGYSQLGVGCTDTYAPAQNGFTDLLGPPSLINGTTAAFPYPFTAPPVTGILDRRLQVLTSDITPAQNPGALYFVEVQYIAPDDAMAGNGFNNASYRRVVVPSALIAPVVQGPTLSMSPAIQAWRDTDASVRLAPADYLDESGVPARFWVAAKATDNGDGSWHYEYAVQNLNADRSAGSFRVPLPPSTTASNFGFHAPRSHSGEPYSNAAWNASVSDGAVVFATEPYATNPDANALRWSTLYNFRFDAGAPPIDGTVVVGLFKPGSPETVAAAGLPVPASPPCAGDLNADHTVDLADLAVLLAHFGATDAGPADGDIDGDGNVNLSDLAALLSNFGSACP